MNNKGFTLVEILAAVTILGILTVMAIGGYTRYIDYAKKQAYKNMAKSVSTAAEEYVMDNPGIAVKTKKKNLDGGGFKYILNDARSPYVSFSELIEEGYLNGAGDPNNKGHNCEGKVRIGLVEAASKKALDQYIYVVDLCCAGHESHFLYTVQEKDGKVTYITEETLNNADCS